ncbi:MAG: sugar phosphate isomerase/epimerase family protein [Flavisolibacter sp.]
MPNRRKFIKASVSAGTALLLSSLDTFATHKPFNSMPKDFDLKILATNWGFSGSLDEYCAKVKKEGYDGIEIWWPMEAKDQDELFSALKKYGLEVGFLTGGQQSEYTTHFDFFKKMIDGAALNKVQRPLYINCHSGRDYFSHEQNQAFIDHTTQLSKQTGILICHETHRSRMLFAAPVARQYIERNPELRITFDVSHWCNVSESLLQDQKETIDMTLERVGHIHARIGHPEGPQVNDPRAPEWDAAVKAHFSWWDKVVERKRNNKERLTILTEFGPPDYMPVTPYTRQPLADQWAINVYMMQTLRKRYLS